MASASVGITTRPEATISNIAIEKAIFKKCVATPHLAVEKGSFFS